MTFERLYTCFRTLSELFPYSHPRVQRVPGIVILVAAWRAAPVKLQDGCGAVLLTSGQAGNSLSCSAFVFITVMFGLVPDIQA